MATLARRDAPRPVCDVTVLTAPTLDGGATGRRPLGTASSPDRSARRLLLWLRMAMCTPGRAPRQCQRSSSDTAAGVIDYRRSQATIVEGSGLDAAAGECYGVIATAFDRLIRPSPRSPPAALVAMIVRGG